MNFTARLAELAKIRKAATPVVSVYVNTRWADEHQRERVRVFLKNEIRKARQAEGGRASVEDLNWIQWEGDALVTQATVPEAHGIALFACHALGLREVVPVRVPFEDIFVVANAPFLRPLAALVDEVPSTLVVFVDGQSARLIPLGLERAGEEVVLESEVPGHHRRGGWAQLAQSRYQRHIQDHRRRHFEAVVETLVRLAEGNGVRRIVMAGEPRRIAAFRKHVPERIGPQIVGSVPGARHESAGVLVARAAELLAHLEQEQQREEVDAVLTEAAKSRQAVAGIEETIEAVSRGAVDRLYLLKAFSEAGGFCSECKALQRGSDTSCRLCAIETKATELGEDMVSRVIAAGGKVTMIEVHPRLGHVGGVAALLRYPL